MVVSTENRPTLPSQMQLAWPLLRVLQAADGPMTNKAMAAAVADTINLSVEPRELEKSPTGRGSRTLLDYKLGWSRTILKDLGAVEKVAPATWAVTEEGRRLVEADIEDYRTEMLDRLAERSRAKVDAHSRTLQAENSRTAADPG
jgi:restriction endonuclease Mrr